MAADRGSRWQHITTTDGLLGVGFGNKLKRVQSQTSGLWFHQHSYRLVKTVMSLAPQRSKIKRNKQVKQMKPGQFHSSRCLDQRLITRWEFEKSLHAKNEIEGIVKEMLQAGTIQPGISPFSALILLVRKKDNSWRMCVDYRTLNNNTVED
ncbi:hypothetical protein WN944_010601 [Citrus x changshan-huyou]|uniref:Uncharacterized protein n=1 Tax=Citrus x changshan-huyou TaxID=2935761 RepID=A0AAP0MV78_9ROSI